MANRRIHELEAELMRLKGEIRSLVREMLFFRQRLEHANPLDRAYYLRVTESVMGHALRLEQLYFDRERQLDALRAAEPPPPPRSPLPLPRSTPLDPPRVLR